jgi:hypothetical protein
MGPSVQQGDTGNGDPTNWSEDFTEVEDPEFGNVRVADEIETEHGISKFVKGTARVGWLQNMGSVRWKCCLLIL